jgi:hypothetical protein
MASFWCPEVKYSIIVAVLTQPLLMGTGLPSLIEQMGTAPMVFREGRMKN